VVAVGLFLRLNTRRQTLEPKNSTRTPHADHIHELPDSASIGLLGLLLGHEMAM
jgi:hypothetical protein